MATSDSNSPDFVSLAAEIVSAFVTNNAVPAAEVPDLLSTVHGALAKVADELATAKTPEPALLTPAVSVRKSITPDYLVCLDDGLKFKSLKRHLNHLGMTPDRYRAKWNLPADYPMVAANYAAQRSEMAKEMGLGQRQRKKA